MPSWHFMQLFNKQINIHYPGYDNLKVTRKKGCKKDEWGITIGLHKLF